MQLPFLVVHGATIYTVAAIAVVLFSIWSLWRRRLRMARERTNDTLAELGPVTSAANFTAGSPAVVKGVIEFSKDTELVGVLIPFYSTKGSEYVDLGTGVTLKGESRWQCEGQAEVLWAADLSSEPAKLTVQVHSGEEVLLKGTLEALSSSSDKSASYREASIEWRLVGTEQSPIQIVSTQSPRPRLGLWGVALSGLTGLAAFALGAQIIGASCVSNSEVRVVDGELDYPTSLLVAAAMPFHRDDALRHISYSLNGYNKSLGEQGTLAGIELDILQGECPSAALRALKANLWDVAKQTIARCPAGQETQHASYQIYLYRGEFFEASKSISELSVRSSIPNERVSDIPEYSISWLAAANIHLLAGDYLSAAKLLENEAEMWGNAPREGPNTYYSPENLDRIEKSMHCLALASRRLAGEVVQLSMADTPTCQLLQTEQLGPQKRLARLSEMTDNYDRFVELLSIEAGVSDRRMSYSEPSIVHISNIVTRMHIFRVPLHLGLLSSAYESVAAHSGARWLRATLGIELAYWKAIFGEESVAQQLFVEARENLLLLSPELRALSQELAESPDPLKADRLKNSDEFNQINNLYIIMGRLELAEVGLAALASRRGDLKSAERHIAIAMAYRGSDYREDYYGPDGFVNVGVILGKAIPEGSIRYGNQECEPECTPGQLRAGAHTSLSTVYPQFSLANILELGDYAHTIDAPQWHAEVQAAKDRWIAAFFDRDRSLILGLVNAL